MLLVSVTDLSTHQIEVFPARRVATSCVATIVWPEDATPARTYDRYGYEVRTVPVPQSGAGRRAAFAELHEDGTHDSDRF